MGGEKHYKNLIIKKQKGIEHRYKVGAFFSLPFVFECLDCKQILVFENHILLTRVLFNAIVFHMF